MKNRLASRPQPSLSQGLDVNDYTTIYSILEQIRTDSSFRELYHPDEFLDLFLELLRNQVPYATQIMACIQAEPEYFVKGHRYEEVMQACFSEALAEGLHELEVLQEDEKQGNDVAVQIAHEAAPLVNLPAALDAKVLAAIDTEDMNQVLTIMTPLREEKPPFASVDWDALVAWMEGLLHEEHTITLDELAEDPEGYILYAELVAHVLQKHEKEMADNPGFLRLKQSCIGIFLNLVGEPGSKARGVFLEEFTSDVEDGQEAAFYTEHQGKPLLPTKAYFDSIQNSNKKGVVQAIELIDDHLAQGIDVDREVVMSFLTRLVPLQLMMVELKFAGSSVQKSYPDEVGHLLWKHYSFFSSHPNTPSLIIATLSALCYVTKSDLMPNQILRLAECALQSTDSNLIKALMSRLEHFAQSFPISYWLWRVYYQAQRRLVELGRQGSEADLRQALAMDDHVDLIDQIDDYVEGKEEEAAEHDGFYDLGNDKYVHVSPDDFTSFWDAFLEASHTGGMALPRMSESKFGYFYDLPDAFIKLAAYYEANGDPAQAVDMLSLYVNTFNHSDRTHALSLLFYLKEATRLTLDAINQAIAQGDAKLERRMRAAYEGVQNQLDKRASKRFHDTTVIRDADQVGAVILYADKLIKRSSATSLQKLAGSSKLTKLAAISTPSTNK